MKSGVHTRAVAKRLFAYELCEADHMFREDESEYASSYLLLPSGGKANRLFIVGNCVENERNDTYHSARISDCTGTFVVHAGPYQPGALNALREIDTPSCVAVLGKPSTFETSTGNITTSIRPERVVEVSVDTYKKWIVETAEHTIERLNRTADENGYARMADEHYGRGRIDLPDSVISTLEGFQPDTEPTGTNNGRGGVISRVTNLLSRFS